MKLFFLKHKRIILIGTIILISIIAGAVGFYFGRQPDISENTIVYGTSNSKHLQSITIDLPASEDNSTLYSKVEGTLTFRNKGQVQEMVRIVPITNYYEATRAIQIEPGDSLQYKTLYPGTYQIEYASTLQVLVVK